MPDFDISNKSLKAAWVKRLSVPECATWKSLPLEYLRDYGGEFTFSCKFLAENSSASFWFTVIF